MSMGVSNKGNVAVDPRNRIEPLTWANRSRVLDFAGRPENLTDRGIDRQARSQRRSDFRFVCLKVADEVAHPPHWLLALDTAEAWLVYKCMYKGLGDGTDALDIEVWADARKSLNNGSRARCDDGTCWTGLAYALAISRHRMQLTARRSMHHYKLARSSFTGRHRHA